MVGAVAALLLAVVVNGAVISVAEVTVPSTNDRPTRLLHAVAAIGLRAVSVSAMVRADPNSIATANAFNSLHASSTEVALAGRRERRGAYRRGIGRSTAPSDLMTFLCEEL